MIDFRDQQRRRVRGTAGTTKTQAKTLLTSRRGEVKAGTFIKPNDVAVVTFTDAVRLFLEEHTTKTEYTAHAIKAATDYFGDRRRGCAHSSCSRSRAGRDSRMSSDSDGMTSTPRTG